MPVTLTSPVEGLKVGDTYSGPNEDWLVANGYAARPGNFDGLHVSDVPASKDPTLAANREAPPIQGGDVDASDAEDGAAILAFGKSSAHKSVPQTDVELEDDRLYVAPQARLVPAGLEDTDPRVHGVGRMVDGSEYGEDKLSAKVNGREKALKAVEDSDSDRLDVAPQADTRKAVEKTEEADKASDESRETSAKLLEKAESEIPESSINVGNTGKASKRSAKKNEDDDSK